MENANLLYVNHILMWLFDINSVLLLLLCAFFHHHRRLFVCVYVLYFYYRPNKFQFFSQLIDQVGVYISSALIAFMAKLKVQFNKEIIFFSSFCFLRCKLHGCDLFTQVIWINDRRKKRKWTRNVFFSSFKR